MGIYMHSIERHPPSFSKTEQKKMLAVTGKYSDHWRDHIIISLALGTGMREMEIAALNVGDILTPKGRITPYFQLRIFKKSTKQPALQIVYLNETLRAKLSKFIEWKTRRGQSLDPDAPLLISKKKERLSKSRMRSLFRERQTKAGFERPKNFHALRHTAISNHYRLHKNLALTQDFARHRDPMTTRIYTLPTQYEMLAGCQGLEC